ncbi:MAG: HNH endonuclease, partial [Asticcacaulis sp.]
MPEVRDWTQSLWGKASPYVIFRTVENAPLYFNQEQRLKQRMPTLAEKRALLSRDGYHCRFCSIPVIRSEIRNKIVKAFPEISIWGNTNAAQHAAFQAMWVQYDHLLPHSRGGSNSADNMVITCAPCNFARMQYTLEEVGLFNPLLREPHSSDWDGLESFC